MMPTLTAPGADVLPWDRSSCTHGQGVACSGLLGCVVSRSARREWERTLGKRWRNLSQAAMSRVRRMYPGASSPLIGYADELQLRQAWHRHLAVAGGPIGCAYVRHLRDLAVSYGMGGISHGGRVRSGEQAAGYLAGYVAAIAKEGTNVLARAQQRDRGTLLVVYVAPGRHPNPRRRVARGRRDVTMRSLSAGRSLWAARQGLVPWPTGRVVVERRVVDADTGEIVRDLHGARPPPCHTSR